MKRPSRSLLLSLSFFAFFPQSTTSISIRGPLTLSSFVLQAIPPRFFHIYKNLLPINCDTLDLHSVIAKLIYRFQATQPHLNAANPFFAIHQRQLFLNKPVVRCFNSLTQQVLLTIFDHNKNTQMEETAKKLTN